MRLSKFVKSKRAQARGLSLAIGNRSGMTLIEVIVATMLLSAVLLSMASFMARYAKIAGVVSRRIEANELVADRLEEVKGAIRYSAIDSIFAKTEPSIVGHPGLTRQTLVTRTLTGAPIPNDYKTVTVIVNGPGLQTPSKKTTVISVF
ncbi:MAG TPA: prepilin-type N-terminal cleavage/methylation domain-containing protein [Gemmatimonadaceae bacterium]|nr:prepilin-type N-terminal cleavage/methylation domain-containing protein [Gemmatimonadaceae bacterium]